MSRPAPLNPAEQEQLIQQIGLALLRAVPGEWQRILVDYRAAGRYVELTAEVETPDGGRGWPVPPEAAQLFGRLRGGMYGEGRGTWFSARYRLSHPSSYNVDFDRTEPRWQSPPPPQAYQDDLQQFPRTEDNLPDWLRQRAGLPITSPAIAANGNSPSSAPPAPAAEGARFRTARPFDGSAPDGRPSVTRPPVPEAEREPLLGYLENAPIVLAARGHDPDAVTPDAKPGVPVAFHTDGTWIWPAALGYYLRRYGVPPQPDLVEHARGQGFQPPEVDEATRTAAAQLLTGNQPSTPDVPVGSPTPPPPPAVEHEPRAAEPTDRDQQVIGVVQERLTELGVPASAFGIGAARDEAWCLEQIDNGWQVAWYERGEPSRQLRFDRVWDAAALLLGRLLITPPRVRDHPTERPPEHVTPPTPSPPVPHVSRPVPPVPPQVDHATHGDRRAQADRPAQVDRQERPVAPRRLEDWPIQPLAGEPPLTLFRGKQITELPAGAEVDRFGYDEGNLTYQAGTPYENRSLLPEWVNRPYRAYRVQRPLEVLTGVAVPWFDQPGGGAAFLLPRAVNELLAEGFLTEINETPAVPPGPGT